MVSALNLHPSAVAASVVESFWTPIADAVVCDIQNCLGEPFIERMPRPLNCSERLASVLDLFN